MLRLLGDRPLGGRDAAAIDRALDLDPIASCMVAARVEAVGPSPRLLGGQLWTASDPEESLCFSGANLIPLLGDENHMQAFADRATAMPRMCSSIVGPAEQVHRLWERAGAMWGPAREERVDQPLLALLGPPAITPDPLVRQVTLDDLEAYLPAAVEMFIGEVGIDPCAGDGGRSYRRRLAGLISARRAFARFEDGQVVFKAEIGSQSRKVGQIQGIWVDPELRGSGLGSAGTAAVAAAVAARGRIPSLYVNSFNTAARRAYAKVGFEQVGSFATILVD